MGLRLRLLGTVVSACLADFGLASFLLPRRQLGMVEMSPGKVPFHEKNLPT